MKTPQFPAIYARKSTEQSGVAAVSRLVLARSAMVQYAE